MGWLFARRSAARLVFFAALAAGVFMAGGSAFAQALEAPQGSVLLTLSGKISNTTNGKTAEFDRVQLSAMEQVSFRSSHPFLEGVHDFEGVRLSDILARVGAKGDTLVAQALDGYSVEIPMSDVRDFDPIVAMKQNGKVLRVRTRGPLWIVFPVDQYDALRQEVYSGRSIWQLLSIEVK